MIWELNGVQKRNLLGPLKELWGSAVVVADNAEVIQKWINNRCDNAILVCRISINSEYQHEFYPFSVWYGNSSKNMRKVCFADEKVPTRLGDIGTKTRALFWDFKQTSNMTTQGNTCTSS